MSDSFTIYIKCGTFLWQGASPLHGFSMLVDDLNASTAQQVPEIGELVSGNPPNWFRGFVTYSNGTGFSVFTDDSELTDPPTANYFRVTVDDGTPILIGTAGNVSAEGNPHPVRYYSHNTFYGDNLELRTHHQAGTTAKVKIEILDNTLVDTYFDGASLSSDLTQEIGFDRGRNMYGDLVK